MRTKLSVAVLAAALLLSGMLVGVSYGGSQERITSPEVLELKFKAVNVEFFALDDFDGEQRGQLTWLKRSLWDTDGNQVGVQRIECVATVDHGWICTIVSTIKDGAHTDKGTIVATGTYSGFADYSTFAVTGGTGAYSGVGGHVRQEGHRYTLYLVP
jgi:hypothetical protein